MKKKKRVKKETVLDACKTVCHKWLILNDDTYIDVQFGVYFANQFLDSKPTWMYVVGPPGCGKTEILNAWDGHDRIYSLSSLTANTLISGKIQGAKEDDPSLIPKLDGKMLIIKDFTCLLKERHETVTAILGQLRDAFDGSCRKVFGTGKDKIYRSKFGVIAAVTNELDKHLLRLSSLGERFLVYRHEELNPEEQRARAEKACSNVNVAQMEKELKTAAHKVLNLKPASVPTLSDYCKKRILDAALFVARARTSVDRSRHNREIAYLPSPEHPTRLSKQLCDLARGIAMAREKSKVTMSEIRLVQKIALDCIAGNRLKLLKVLAEMYPAKVSINKASDSLKVSYNGARLWLDDLFVLEIVDKYPLNRKSYETRNREFRLKKEYGKLLQTIWSI